VYVIVYNKALRMHHALRGWPFFAAYGADDVSRRSLIVMGAASPFVV
jgi:hypothetical protein